MPSQEATHEGEEPDVDAGREDEQQALGENLCAVLSEEGGGFLTGGIGSRRAPHSNEAAASASTKVR